MALIVKDGKGNWTLDGVPWEHFNAGATLGKKDAELLYGALCKLKDYEDSGLSPDRVEELQDEYEELRDECSDYREKYKFLLENNKKVLEKLELERRRQRERSRIYYDGDKDMELLDRVAVLGTLDEMCVVDGVYRALASLPVIVGKPYPAKEGSGREQNEL